MFFIGLTFLIFLGLVAYPKVTRYIIYFVFKCYIYLHPNPTLIRVMRFKRVLRRLDKTCQGFY